MALDRLNPTLMENVITLLCHNDDQGRLVAQLVNPNLFEGNYRIIAERAVEHWNRYGQAPKFHTADLVADILEDEHNHKGPALRRILLSMAGLAPNVNTEYILDALRKFIQLQKIKDTIIKSADLVNAKQEMSIEEVQDIWNMILRTREIGFDPGIRLSEIDSLLNFMETREREFDTGIPYLDHRNAVPTRGNILLFLAGAGLGKTWFLINCGKRALAQRKKVLHITLELSAALTLQRYYQAVFSLTKREPPEEGIETTTIGFDANGKLTGFGTDNVVPTFHFQSPNIKAELSAHLDWMGNRFFNVIIKQFSPKQLTPNMLRAYLDNLEVTESFIPDLIIVDYLQEMAIDQNNFRISLNHTFSELRAIAIERNCAMVTAQQLAKKGVEALIAKSTHVAEAWALIGTTDVCLTYTCTTQEQQFGLARLYVSKNREDEDHYGVLMTQNYKLGQFVLTSAPLPADYFDHLNKMTEANGGMHDSEGDDEDDE